MPESLRMIIYFLSAFISLFVFAYGGYYFVVSIFGWSDRQTNVMPKTNKIHTFALLVAAHNEEAVIGERVMRLNGCLTKSSKWIKNTTVFLFLTPIIL